MLISASVTISDKMDENRKKVLGRLQSLCAKREYCRSDIMSKAVKLLEGDREAAELVVEALVKDKFVDDLRYASAFAREKSSLSGWGAVKIGYMLSAKGIDRQTIAAALEEEDPLKAEKKMRSVIEAKYRLLADDPQCRLKLLRFALSRGYEYDDVKAVIDSVIKS